MSSGDAATRDDGDVNVGLELALALNGVVVGAMAGVTVSPRPLWAVVPVTAVSFLAAAVMDRHREGYLALVGVGVVLMAVVVWGAVGGPKGLVPIAVAGLGVGVALNRFLFGVVRPVPEARRRRERSRV